MLNFLSNSIIRSLYKKSTNNISRQNKILFIDEKPPFMLHIYYGASIGSYNFFGRFLKC